MNSDKEENTKTQTKGIMNDEFVIKSDSEIYEEKNIITKGYQTTK